LQLETLAELGIEDVCVVVGHQKELILDCLKQFPRATAIENIRYAETNSLYSLWLCRRWVRGAFVCMNADVLAHPNIYREILNSNKTAVGCDRSSGHEDEHMKIEVSNGRVVAMGKALDSKKAWGENVGIVSYNEKGSRKVFRVAQEIIEQGGENCWSPAALDQLAREDQLKIKAVDITGLPWTEIDFPEDLETARFQVWPRIIASLPRPQTAVAAL